MFSCVFKIKTNRVQLHSTNRGCLLAAFMLLAVGRVEFFLTFIKQVSCPGTHLQRWVMCAEPVGPCSLHSLTLSHRSAKLHPKSFKRRRCEKYPVAALKPLQLE